MEKKASICQNSRHVEPKMSVQNLTVRNGSKPINFKFQTRMQSLGCEKQHRMGIKEMLRGMIVEEGWRRPIRGASAMMAGAGPAHAMYFGCIEMGKRFSAKYKTSAIFGDGGSAIMATCLHDAVMTPSEGE